MLLPKVEDAIAGLAEELRRLRIGRQALNASAKLNLIEQLSENPSLLDTLHVNRNLSTVREAFTASASTQRFEESSGSSLVDVGKVNYVCLS
ncbi:MAG: hypothetical protein QW282_06260 [Nitrososphaerales archaeon]